MVSYGITEFSQMASGPAPADSSMTTDDPPASGPVTGINAVPSSGTPVGAVRRYSIGGQSLSIGQLAIAIAGALIIVSLALSLLGMLAGGDS